MIFLLQTQFRLQGYVAAKWAVSNVFNWELHRTAKLTRWVTPTRFWSSSSICTPWTTSKKTISKGLRFGGALFLRVFERLPPICFCKGPSPPTSLFVAPQGDFLCWAESHQRPTKGGAFPLLVESTPLVLGETASFCFRPLVWRGHIDGMVVLWAALAPMEIALLLPGPYPGQAAVPSCRGPG